MDDLGEVVHFIEEEEADNIDELEGLCVVILVELEDPEAEENDYFGDDFLLPVGFNDEPPVLDELSLVVEAGVEREEDVDEEEEAEDELDIRREDDVLGVRGLEGDADGDEEGEVDDIEEDEKVPAEFPFRGGVDDGESAREVVEFLVEVSDVEVLADTFREICGARDSPGSDKIEVDQARDLFEIARLPEESVVPETIFFVLNPAFFEIVEGVLIVSEELDLGFIHVVEHATSCLVEPGDEAVLEFKLFEYIFEHHFIWFLSRGLLGSITDILYSNYFDSPVHAKLGGLLNFGI